VALPLAPGRAAREAALRPPLAPLPRAGFAVAGFLEGEVKRVANPPSARSLGQENQRLCQVYVLGTSKRSIMSSDSQASKRQIPPDFPLWLFNLTTPSPAILRHATRVTPQTGAAR
jgi:hypothetical protein